MSHDAILERWQDDFLGSKIEQSEFRAWLSEQYGEDESSRFTWEDKEELIHKFRETGWWTDTFLDYAYTKEALTTKESK